MAIARQPKPAGGFWEDLAFHAQQAAEFALKAIRLADAVVAWAQTQVRGAGREA